MDTHQAIALLINATSQLSLNRSDHIKIQQAINILDTAIHKDAPADTNKEEVKSEEVKDPIDNDIDKALS